jgi:competence protein ComEC
MRWRSLAAIALSAAFAGGISSGDRAAARSAVAAKPAKIVYVNVGQGDGVVMRIGGKIIVSDTGEQFPEHMDETLRALKAKQIDVAILSHAHEDHVKNTIRLIRDFGWTIKLAVLSDSAWWEGTDTNRELMELLREKKVPRVIATRGQTYDWGGASWRILNPPVHEFTGGSSQAANASVAYLLTVNGVQALFTGDVEPKVGRQIAVEMVPLLPRPVDIFLATHHGSKFGSVRELLDAIHPHWAVISAGAHNAFDHPAPETVARLKASGASIWCTDTNGSITARISAAGRLSWRTSLQRAPYWSGRDQHENGTCNGR